MASFQSPFSFIFIFILFISLKSFLEKIAMTWEMWLWKSVTAHSSTSVSCVGGHGKSCEIGENESRTHSAQWLAHFETTFAFSVTEKVPMLPPPPLTEDKNESVSGEVMVTLVFHHLSSLLLLSRALSWRKGVKCLAGLCVLSEAGTVGTAASHVQMCMIWQLVQPQNIQPKAWQRERRTFFSLSFFLLFSRRSLKSTSCLAGDWLKIWKQLVFRFLPQNWWRLTNLINQSYSTSRLVFVLCEYLS